MSSCWVAESVGHVIGVAIERQKMGPAGNRDSFGHVAHAVKLECPTMTQVRTFATDEFGR